MLQPYPSYSSFMLSAALVLCETCSAAPATAKAPQAQSQMRQMASRAAASPIKLGLQPGAATVPLGSSVSLKVSILNADNQPASWERQCTVNLEITFPSKKVERQTVIIPREQSSG